MEFQDWLFDKRVIRRNLRQGLITTDILNTYLEGLPDSADNVTSIWDMRGVIDDDFDEDYEEEEEEEEDTELSEYKD